MPYTASYHQPKKSKTKFIVIAMVPVILLGAFGAWKLFGRHTSSHPADPVAKVEAPKESNISSVEAKYLFSGTVVPARAVENQARTANGIDYNQPFSQLDTFNPSQYDGWTIDMECPVTTDNLSYREQVDNTMFNCRPEFLPAMSKYFTVMNLANNHVYDRGKDKFPAQQQFINDAGIQFLGNYDPAVKEDVCEVMGMKVNLKKKDGESEAGTLPIAFCAWHYFMRGPEPGEFDVMKEYAKIMPVFGLMQVGVEYVPKAGADQEEIGRKIIDGGAEFVIGNSPHWVQNSDVYKGKLIFYSTGNFIFDQLDEETNRGASVEVNMSVNYDENVAKWLALAQSCNPKSWRDTCLQAAKDQNLTKIKPQFTFGLVASTTGFKQITKKAGPAIQAAVEKRANWAETLQALGQQ